MTKIAAEIPVRIISSPSPMAVTGITIGKLIGKSFRITEFSERR